MKNLKALLALKAKNVKFVVLLIDGSFVPLADGVKGVVHNVDDSILKELFNETTLSEENAEAFKQIKKVKLPQTSKPKKEKEKVKATS